MMSIQTDAPELEWKNGTLRVETQDELSDRYAVALLPLTIVFGVFAFVGLVGNGVVLFVFQFGREYKKSNFRVFVLCLGIIDFLTCAFLIPAEMVKHRSYFAFESLFMCKTKCLFYVWAGIAAAISLLIICIDRFIKVVLPLRKQITPNLAFKLCVVFSLVVPLVLSIPGAVMCGVLPRNITNIYNTQTEVHVCATEPMFEKSVVRVIYKSMFIVLLVGICVVSLVFYALIWKQIVKHWECLPANFRKNSGTDTFSDVSSNANGNINRIVDVKNKEYSPGSASHGEANHIPLTQFQEEPGCSAPVTNDPLLARQTSSSDINTMAPQTKSLNRQVSSVSCYTLTRQSRKGSEDSSPRRRTLSRQTSSFVLRKFPYKTLIWFILTIVFIFTYILNLVYGVQVDKFHAKPAGEFVVFNLFYRLYFINNIINPIIYGLLDKRFRKKCRELGSQLKRKLLCSSP